MASTANVTNARGNYTTGAVMSAPLGTSLPASATAAVTSFTDWGYIDEDGIVKTIERETETKKDMNGNTILVVTTSHSLKFKFKPAELLPEALKVTVGDDNVTVDEDGAIESYVINADELVNRAFVFNLLLKDGRLMRVCCPELALLSQGEETMKVSEILDSELEFEAMPDASGNKAYVYFATPTPPTPPEPGNEPGDE